MAVRAGNAVMSINFFRDSQAELSQPHQKSGAMPHSMLWVYRVANVMMNSLNAMWFYKMAKGAIKVLTVSHKGAQHQGKQAAECEASIRD